MQITEIFSASVSHITSNTTIRIYKRAEENSSALFLLTYSFLQNFVEQNFTENCNSSYICYYLGRETIITSMQRASEHSAQGALTIDLIKSIEIELPDLIVQQHIVNTIGTVDDLIEKYEEIINSIKRTRSHLFSKYKGLAISEDEILNHISLENGAQPPKEQHIYEEKEGYVRFVQNRDYDSDSHLTYIPVSKKNHLCNVFDIMMDKYGDAGAVRYGIAGAFNVALLKIISKKNYEKEYIRDFLSQNDIKSILFSSSQASTRPSLNETTFKGVLIPLPDRASLEEYEDKTSLLLRIEFETKKKVAKLKEIKQQLLQKYF